MAKQTINIGTSANDRTGDPLRTAFTKVNQNFTEVYNSIVTDISDLTDNLDLLYYANTGDITFDGIKIIGSGTASGDGLGYSTLELVPDNDLYATDQYIIVDPTAPNHIHLRAGGPQDNSSADFFLGGENTNIKISDGSDTVTIMTTQIDENPINFSWTFDNTGRLALPFGGAIESAGMGWTGFTNGDSGTPISIVNKSANVSYADQVVSDITLSNNTDTQGRIYIGAFDLVEEIYNSWIFDYDGTVTFPTLTTNIHNGGEQTAQTLKFGDATQQVIITGPTPDTDVSAQRIIIQGQRGLGTGEGGDVYLWAGDSEDGGGGDIKIYAGDTDNANTGYGGYINIDAGNGYNAGGQLNLTAGNSALYGGYLNITAGTANDSSGIGGNVNITAGYGVATSGNINLNTYGYTWSFNESGGLVFPDLTSQTTAWMGGSVTTAPNTSIGSSNDKEGDIAFDSTYFYYCTTDYVGNTDIWKRVAWSNDTW